MSVTCLSHVAWCNFGHCVSRAQHPLRCSAAAMLLQVNQTRVREGLARRLRIRNLGDRAGCAHHEVNPQAVTVPLNGYGGARLHVLLLPCRSLRLPGPMPLRTGRCSSVRRGVSTMSKVVDRQDFRFPRLLSMHFHSPSHSDAYAMAERDDYLQGEVCASRHVKKTFLCVLRETSSGNSSLSLSIVSFAMSPSKLTVGYFVDSHARNTP